MDTQNSHMQNVPSTPSGLPQVGDLFSKAWELFTTKRRSVWRLALYVFLLQFALGIIAILLGLTATGGVFGALSTGEPLITGTVVGVSIILMIVFVIAYILLYAWIQGAFILLFNHNEAEPNVSTVISEARPFIVPLWWASILVGITVFIGLVLFIIPGIIFAVWYSFTGMIVILERLRGWEAMSKSKSYVQGKWWAVLGRMAALAIVIGLVSVIADNIFYALGDYVGTLLSSLLTAFVFAPFAIAFQYLLYRNVSAPRTQEPMVGERYNSQ